MIFLYNIFIQLYIASAKFISLWNKKAKKWTDGRVYLGQKVLVRKKQNEEIYWFHCASVGEYEQALPLIQNYQKKYPEIGILTTFYSPSGYEYAQKRYPDEWISYLPYDKKEDVKNFIDWVNPNKVFIIKYEFWYHLLSQIHEKKIPLFLISGVFRKDQFFFKWYGSFFRKILVSFSHLFVQDELSKKLLNQIGINAVTVSGDTRLERVLDNKKEIFFDKKLNSFLSGSKIFIAGSVWNSDIPILNEIMKWIPQDWKTIIVPHEVNRFSTDKLKIPYVKYSEIKEFTVERDVVILDTIGMLSKLYRYAQFAYIGGGFGKGIHNVLEPIAYEIPVFIGPQYQKFLEAVDLIQKGCIFEINTKNAGVSIQKKILSKKKFKEIQSKINRYISVNTNLSEKIIVYIEDENQKWK